MIELNEQQFCALIMAKVSISEDYIMKTIREKFKNRDRPWTEAQAQAEYRYQLAIAIIDRSRS